MSTVPQAVLVFIAGAINTVVGSGTLLSRAKATSSRHSSSVREILAWFLGRAPAPELTGSW